MNTKTSSYQVIDFPAERRTMPAFLDLNLGKHCMYALLEVDVTRIRQYIEAYKVHTGERLSFTGYLIACLARAVDENKAVQAYRKGGRRLAVCDDVNVGMMIELEKDEKRILAGHVIHRANHKPFREIHDEIREVQTHQTPVSATSTAWFNTAMLLPWPLSRLVKALALLIRRDAPERIISMAGSVGISSVGMFGAGHSGWGIFTGSHTLDLIVGGTALKASVVEGCIEPRQILSLTLIFDHAVIDGAPAARFARRLVELIESGYGLDEETPIAFAGSFPTPREAVIIR